MAARSRTVSALRVVLLGENRLHGALLDETVATVSAPRLTNVTRATPDRHRAVDPTAAASDARYAAHAPAMPGPGSFSASRSTRRRGEPGAKKLWLLGEIRIALDRARLSLDPPTRSGRGEESALWRVAGRGFTRR